MATIAELRAKFGEIASVKLPDGRVIAIRRPDGPAYKRFTDRITDDKAQKSTAFDELVLSCTVEPGDREAARAILNDYPALAVKLATAAQELAGADLEVSKSGDATD
jgi:hypothetical protein